MKGLLRLARALYLASQLKWAQRMSHTPGPWIIDLENDIYITVHAEHRDICDMTVDFGDVAEAEANASLIAAAPEMLRALEAAREFISNGVEFGYIWMPEDGDPALETSGIIEAAIRKARGGE